MKKRLVFLLLAVLFLLPAAGCGKAVPTDFVGKTFVCEKEGALGYFSIMINADGTFSYSEGFLSSYIGMGSWTLEGDVLTLRNEVPTLNGAHLITNVFEIGKRKLIWREEGSDNFSMVKLEDGEAFREK